MANIAVLASVFLTVILLLVNFYYSYQSKKMLEDKIEETQNELMMATRPLLVARAVAHEGAMTYEHDNLPAPQGTKTSDDRPAASHFSHFELFNAGNSPAIGLEISLMDEKLTVIQSESLGFLRNNEQALTFVPITLDINKTYNLVCEYDSIRSRVRKMWYQTWLPFKTTDGSTKGTINVDVGELDFREVPASMHSIASLKPK
jgi:hypothetical protein